MGNYHTRIKQSCGPFSSSVNEIINLGKKVISDSVDEVTKQFASFVQTQMDIIWSSSKAMEFMTASQLQHYQIDCKQYEPKLKLQFLSDIESYLTNFVSIFEYSMTVKQVTPCFAINKQWSRLKFYVDMRLYESIIYHLFTNAVKFSPNGGII